tara:strand:- start:1014 stop:1199 length:186 start_codon:yes stop_codon:yes gene_type:complete
MNYKHLDEIEGDLIDIAIDDPIGFRKWLADFLTEYIDNDLEGITRIKIQRELQKDNENENE